MLKAYAAFVKNTIEPIIDKAGLIIEYAEKKGLPIDKESLQALLEKFFLANVCMEVIRGIINIIITIIVCYVSYLILR